MSLLPCPYLGRDVELTDERRDHIRHRHPDLALAFTDRISRTLADPDRVYRSVRDEEARLFCSRYDDMYGGKHMVVVVVVQPDRAWVVTAYIARRWPEGPLEWNRD